MMNTTFGMSRGRLWIVHAAIFLFLGVSFYEIIADQENWPFSSYQMYSRVRSGQNLLRPRMFGITDEETPREIPLLKFEYIQPFDQSRLARAFTRMKDRPSHNELYARALQNCLSRYEILRQNGRHHGPPLRGIRLYELEWKFDPWAGNRDLPDRKELLGEVMESRENKSR